MKVYLIWFLYILPVEKYEAQGQFKQTVFLAEKGDLKYLFEGKGCEYRICREYLEHGT